MGQYEGVPAKNEVLTKVTLLHAFLRPNARITLPAAAMAFVYGLKGTAQAASEQTLNAQMMVNYSFEGDEVTLLAGPEGFEFLFGTGKPLNEPIVYGGPFVMTTSEQMVEAKGRYSRGEMGRLAPY